MKGRSLLFLIRNFLLELLLYAALVVVYFVLVLRWLGDPLLQMFGENLRLYAVVSLMLIIIQGVALDAITGFLVERLGLERLE